MKRKWMGLMLTGVAAVMVLAGCAPAGDAGSKGVEDGVAAETTAEMAYHKIDAEEAKRMIGEGDVTIVDVRRPEEYAEKHLEGALNIPNETIGEEPPAELADKDAKLVVYCRTGVRSKQASDKLVKMGYHNVYDMGGIADWPYETVS
ncbi:rhodanese-like domain-containing protein [Christensenella timonensis]|uniref:rhodanese-like domain-containing protein n=1 Tax=Christensenella timonensis TaxID=1816678 RepID=UPI000830E5D0|nr:rhodanese-like domain-containing protein [Christensenella timonensis]